MASGPITSWQMANRETMETVTDFIFLGSKITEDGDCIHEIKTCLLLGRKAMTNLDNILKSRDIALPTKVHVVKTMVLPVVMYGCESWTIKKAEPLKNWCFQTVVLEKTLESPLDCKEIQPVSLFSRSVVSNSLRPHGLQHARPPCPSPTSRVYSNSCPSSQWCHPAISSSVVPFSSCLESEQTLGDSERQGSLACYSPWGHKESDATEWLNKKSIYIYMCVCV